MTALHKVLGALSDHGSTIKPHPGYYMAQCPSHSDSRESLKISEGTDGRVLLKCFAQCDSAKIVADLGLSMSDLFESQPDRKERTTAKARLVEEYYYLDTEAELWFVVERWDPKRFPQKRPDGNGGWIWSTSDLPLEVKALPYRLPELAKALANDPTRRVLIVEGEKDVNSLWKHGELATTMAQGAKVSSDRARVDAFYGHLKAAGAHLLGIIADRDAPGREHAQRLLEGAQRAGIKSVAVEFGCDDKCKDATDAISAHGDDWEAQLAEIAKTADGGVDNVDNVDTWPLTRGNAPENCQRTVNAFAEVSTLLQRLGIMGEFATALADATQVDKEFALASALATVALPVGLSVNVEVRSDWVEPAILQCLLIAPPSERKSPVLGVCMAPIYDAEREAREARKAQIARAKAIEAELELEKANARKSGGYRDACERLENHTIPNEFRAILGKATAEALEVLAARQGERIARVAVVSDEGGAVFGDLGRYQNSTNWELLLAGYDGRRYSSDRLSRASVLVDELRIPLFVMLQPSAWDEVKDDPAASGRGVLSRLSPIRPRSLVGERFGFGAPISKVLTARWSERLTALFEQAYASDGPIRSTLSPGAFDVWAAFKDQVETELGDDTFEGDLLTGWGGKKAGRALRLAAIVHAALTGELGGEISEDEMGLGIELATWLGLHALREFGGAGVAALLSRDARKLLDVAEELGEFKRREALRKLHRWTVPRFTKAAKELEAFGIIESEDARGLGWKWLGNSESVNALPKVSTQVSTPKTDITAGQGPSVNVVNVVNASFDDSEKSNPEPQPPPPKPAKKLCSHCDRELLRPDSIPVGICVLCDPKRREDEPLCAKCERYLATIESKRAGVCSHHAKPEPQQPEPELADEPF